VACAALGLQILAGAAAAGLLGLGVGLLTLRLRGIFFSIATIANHHHPRDGGAELDVCRWCRPADPAADRNSVVRELPPQWLFFVHAVIAVVAIRGCALHPVILVRRGLRAIRDNEVAAECSGVPDAQVKLTAATVSGALMGARAHPTPMLGSFIEPNAAFSLNHAVNALAMRSSAAWGTGLGRDWPVLLGGLQQIVTVTLSSEMKRARGGRDAGDIAGGGARGDSWPGEEMAKFLEVKA